MCYSQFDGRGRCPETGSVADNANRKAVRAMRRRSKYADTKVKPGQKVGARPQQSPRVEELGGDKYRLPSDQVVTLTHVDGVPELTLECSGEEPSRWAYLLLDLPPKDAAGIAAWEKAKEDAAHLEANPDAAAVAAAEKEAKWERDVLAGRLSKKASAADGEVVIELTDDEIIGTLTRAQRATFRKNEAAAKAEEAATKKAAAVTAALLAEKYAHVAKLPKEHKQFLRGFLIHPPLWQEHYAQSAATDARNKGKTGVDARKVLENIRADARALKALEAVS